MLLGTANLVVIPPAEPVYEIEGVPEPSVLIPPNRHKTTPHCVRPNPPCDLPPAGPWPPVSFLFSPLPLVTSPPRPGAGFPKPTHSGQLNIAVIPKGTTHVVLGKPSEAGRGREGRRGKLGVNILSVERSAQGKTTGAADCESSSNSSSDRKVNGLYGPAWTEQNTALRRSPGPGRRGRGKHVPRGHH